MNVVNFDEFKLMNSTIDCILGADDDTYKQSFFIDCARTGRPAGEFINASNIENIRAVLNSYFQCVQSRLEKGDVFDAEKDVVEVLAWIIYDEDVMRLLGKAPSLEYMNQLKSLIQNNQAVRNALRLFEKLQGKRFDELQSSIWKKIVRLCNSQKDVLDVQVELDQLVLKYFARLILQANQNTLVDSEAAVFLYWYITKCKSELSQYFYIGFTEHRDVVYEFEKVIQTLDIQLMWENHFALGSINDPVNTGVFVDLVK